MNNKFPKRSRDDTVHAILKGAVSAVPILGGPLSVLVDELFTPSLEKRRQDWLERLCETIKEIDTKLNEVEEIVDHLSSNELFISTTLQATRIAMRNHSQIKLKALQNAIKSSALNHDLDENQQIMYLRFIDDLTPFQIRMLIFLNNTPKEYSDDSWDKLRNQLGKGKHSLIYIKDIFKKEYPEIIDRDSFFRIQVEQLEGMGLLVKNSMSQGAVYHGRILKTVITKIGKDFIKYIEGEEFD